MCYNNKCQVNKCGCGETGRRAGLRNQCQRRGGSSPLIRTNNVSVRTPSNRIYAKSIRNKNLVDFLFTKRFLLLGMKLLNLSHSTPELSKIPVPIDTKVFIFLLKYGIIFCAGKNLF